MTYREIVALEAMKILLTERVTRVDISNAADRHKVSAPTVLADSAFDIADEMVKEAKRPHRADKIVEEGPRGFVLMVGKRFIDAAGDLTDDVEKAYRFSRPGAEMYAAENDKRFHPFTLELAQAEPQK